MGNTGKHFLLVTLGNYIFLVTLGNIYLFMGNVLTVSKTTSPNLSSGLNFPRSTNKLDFARLNLLSPLSLALKGLLMLPLMSKQMIKLRVGRPPYLASPEPSRREPRPRPR
jgi:hypothetical protein